MSSFVFFGQGSSPRMRGAHGVVFWHERVGGIIPAYAGSTRSSHLYLRGSWDHPRVCGEHVDERRRERRRLGSSPRMRGAHCGSFSLDVGHGIIPAYAGSTRSRTRFTHRGWDHPRVCGEHMSRMLCTMRLTGSSPRMRGARPSKSAERLLEGIIPAYAGSTLWRRAKSQPMRDHPRVCGEHGRLLHRQLQGLGSSPRMRGAHLVRIRVVDPEGIIPAYAGSTSCSSRRSARCRDHPRVCGEHATKLMTLICCMGSSPRMRGARDELASRLRRFGIIPAYAGSTRLSMMSS